MSTESSISTSSWAIDRRDACTSFSSWFYFRQSISIVPMRHHVQLKAGTAEPEVLGLQFATGTDPMWIFDRESHVFLDVNEIAVQRYGYSRQEFLSMTTLDIGPTTDIPNLLRSPLHYRLQGDSTAQRRRHQAKNGTVFPVAITSWKLTFHGRQAELVRARTDALVDTGVSNGASQNAVGFCAEPLRPPATKASMGRALLICNDAAATRQVTESMQQFAIEVEVCDETLMALRLLNRKKFEAVIVDLGLERAAEILQQIRLSPSNRTAVTFAVTDAQTPTSQELQSNFVIRKPLSPTSVGRTLKAAFGLIVRERRRSFRCPIRVPAVILTDGREFNCQVINISESGMAIAGSPSIKPGGPVKVVFTLPGQHERFTIESEVCWYDEKGRAGLRSRLISSDQQTMLQEWLAAKLEEDLPEDVASQFRKH
jgi:PAS domain S-box-containing protein